MATILAVLLLGLGILLILRLCWVEWQANREIERRSRMTDARKAALERLELWIGRHPEEEQVYGFPCSKDPRDFSPDAESCTPEEIASHALAEKLWTEANGKPEGWDAPDFGGWKCDDEHKSCWHILKAPWGIGVCTFRDPEIAQVKADLATLRSSLLEPVGEPRWRPMKSAPVGESILTLMKHGAIEGVWDGSECRGYYWTDITWYPYRWMPLPPAPSTDGESDGK